MGKAAMCMVAAALSSLVAWAEDVTVLGTDKDFESLAPFAARSIVHWAWSEDQKKNAAQFSRTDLTRDPATGTMTYKVKLAPDFPWRDNNIAVLNLGMKYFPPEADAIRITAKVESGGKMILAFGGPTACYGNSDAMTRPVLIDAASSPDWKTYELSLAEGMLRNFRRANYSKTAPWIYYTRWAQEPTYLLLFQGSAGEMTVKNIEVVATGHGRPFPEFKQEAVKTIADLADFAKAWGAGRTFTMLLAEEGDTLFQRSWDRKEDVKHPPPEMALVDASDGKKSLAGKSMFAEEIKCFGAKVTGVPGANAIQYRIRVETDSVGKMLPDIDCQPVDFLIFESSTGVNFDWEPFAPSEELKKGPGHGYDYNLGRDKIAAMTDLPIAFYHARRFVKRGEWTDLIVPFADFLCIYGSGGMTSKFQRQEMLASDKIIAIAFLAPWPRKWRQETAVLVERASLVQVPGEARDLKSYYQFEDLSKVRMKPSKTGGLSLMLLPGETEIPPFLDEILAR
jgi:hypothetical protein